jgi:predicted hotdog family 3-hydroxylacyl-ACP dehydratase
MLDRTRILSLIPHQGAMCLLDQVIRWTDSAITCHATSHLAENNPLRREGQLSAVCGIEYGLQTACLHGALSLGKPQPPGFLAALRNVQLLVRRLDDPAIGTLAIEAVRDLQSSAGLIYNFTLRSASGRSLILGRATIVLP